jgi:hypothetical protein
MRHVHQYRRPLLLGGTQAWGGRTAGIHAYALTLLTAFTRLWDSPLDSDGTLIDPDALDYEEDRYLIVFWIYDIDKHIPIRSC